LPWITDLTVLLEGTIPAIKYTVISQGNINTHEITGNMLEEESYLLGCDPV
jgi:hypothetical protein